MTEPRIINGRYRIERALQVGPMATTHLARDLEAGDPPGEPTPDSFVVLKELSLQAHAGDSSEALARYKLLEREARILRNLEHAGIPTFVDTFRTESDGRVSVWLVQEYREGRNLHDMVADGWHGSAEDIAGILRQVAEILAYLHTRVPAIVHRDVKPANIIVGSDDRVSLVDLGAACTRALENRTGSTIVGTPGYVPMEQFVGQAVPASDVFALGMVGIHLITHEEPLNLIREDGTVHYEHLAQLEHPTLLPTIKDMVEPRVGERLRNARAVLDRLDGVADADSGRGVASSNSRPGSRGSASPRGRAFAYAGAAIALMGMLSAGIVIMSGRASPPANSGESAERVEEYTGDESYPDDDDAIAEDTPSEGILGLLLESSSPEPPQAAPPTGCQVDVQWKQRGGAFAHEEGETVECASAAGMLEPMIVGPDRVRMVLDEVPLDWPGKEPDDDSDDGSEPELRGWLAADGSNPYFVVDATHAGFEVRGVTGCPQESNPVAATLDHNGDVHMACLDFSSLAHHVVFNSQRGTARIQGSFGLDYENGFAEYIESEGVGTREFLAVPRRGPALLLYTSYDPEILHEGYRVQPLARGAKSFSLLPPQLSEVGEWTLYNHAGRVHALARAHKKGDEAPALHKVAVTAMGTRLAGNLKLDRPVAGDVFCHRVTTASDGARLLLRSPNEYGDRMLEAALADSHAIPGPDTASADNELCGDGEQLFVRVGRNEARVLIDEPAWNHRLACAAKSCTLAYNRADGTVIVPLTVP